LSHEQKVALIDRSHLNIGISRQAELLDISRASVYYTPRPNPEEVRITRAIDEVYTRRPFYGSRRMQGALEDYHQIHIGRHRVRRLMGLMGLEAIYPKKRPQTSISEPTHRKYPYLLGGLTIDRPNQVWGTDITYIRLEEGWAYLAAIIDWFSRYVISWKISPTLESDFCIAALNDVLERATPEIFNSDQGTQFTTNDFSKILTASEIKISMDGRGRCMDNIFTERLWRTVKYENVYLKSYRDISEAEEGLYEYFLFYNNERRHQSLNNQTPATIYFNNQRSRLKFKISLPPILSNLSTITV